MKLAGCTLKVFSIASLLAISLGCGSEESSTPQNTSGDSGSSGGPAREQYTIGVIAKSQSNPVFQAARTGAQDAARDLSAERGIDVKIEWRTPNTEDAQLQAQYLEQLASQGADGIAISCSDAALLTGTIDDAYERHGVEVVCFDSDAPESARFAYYGIDDVEAGRAVMRRLAEEMGGSGLVAILAGNQNAPNLQARVRGVREEMANHSGITLDQVYYHPETAADAASMVQQVQASKPEIAGWAMVGGWPLFTENALDGVHDKAKVVSVDHLPPQLEYVRDGQVQALIGQDCYGWGYQSVVMLIDKLHEGKDPESEISHFELQVVTQDNVDEFEGIWDKWVPGG
jgi:ribose transport system substrate-binding protein